MGSSGGSSSGKTDYPDYMKTRHEQWLLALGNQLPDGTSPDASPFLGVTSYNPDTFISAMDTEIGKLVTYADSVGLNATSIDNLWESLTDIIATKLDAKLTTGAAFITSAAGSMSAAIISGIAPLRAAFRAGMREINAVNTSIFTLGDAIIDSKVTAEITKVGGEALIRSVADRNRGITDGGLQLLASVIGFGQHRRDIAALSVDLNKIKIIAKKEQLDKQVEYDVEEAKWEYYQWEAAGNLLGSISGGRGGGAVGSKPNPWTSALGGAMSGAAVGTAISPGIGTAIGAVVGGIGGYLSATL